MTPVDICDRCGTFIIKGKCWCTPPLSDLLGDEHTPKMQAFVDALKQRQAAYDFRQECQRPDESASVVIGRRVDKIIATDGIDTPICPKCKTFIIDGTCWCHLESAVAPAGTPRKEGELRLSPISAMDMKYDSHRKEGE